MNTLIFTDLDGTLLDNATKSFAPAMQALRRIDELGIPLIFCSSKTRAEIEHYREKIGNRHPFITENGGAIFVPEGYFDFPFPHSFVHGQYRVIALGAPYERLRSILKRIAVELGITLKGFGDMSVDELANVTGLPLEEAKLAKQREYDEPFIIETGEEEDVVRAIRNKGYQITHAQFLHILGASDKGKAVSVLKGLYRTKLDIIRTMALGDSPNDLSMFEKVDVPVLVQKPDGTYDNRITLHRLQRAEGIGPEGWNKAVMEFLGE